MSTATANPTAEILDWTNERYHSDAPASVSHSELDAFIDSPELYYGRYVSKQFPGERTKPLEFGSVFHEIGLGIPFDCGPDNYSHHTIANFHATATPETEPDYISDSGSRYWHKLRGLVRQSDHWGEVGGCFWNLFGWDGETATGYCPWSHFHYSETFVPIPARALSKDGARRGKAWEEFESEHAGRTLFKPEEFDPIGHMLDAIYAEPMARALMEADGRCEQTIRWTDEQTGLVRRAKLDKWIESSRPIRGTKARRLIVDIKTAASVKPRKCASMAEEHGYHRQVAYYQDAIEALTGERLPFAFIFIQKSPPYTVAVFDLHEDFIEQGRRENQLHLRKLARSFATKQWHEPTRGKIFTISAPMAAHYKSSWEVPDDGDC